MKKYNIIEAVKAPMGTEFKFVNENGIEQIAVVVRHRGDKANTLNISDSSDLALDSITADYEFEKIEKPMTFNEVLEKVKEDDDIGIRVEHEDISFIRSNKSAFSNSYWTFVTIMEELSKEYSSASLADIIAEGKWYIREE